MAKKKNRNIIYIVLALLLVGGLFFFISPTKPKGVEHTEVPGATSEGGLSLKACFSDGQGNCLSPFSTALYLGGGPESKKPLAAYLEKEGGVICHNMPEFLTIQATLDKSGDIPEVIVSDITAVPLVYDTEIDNDYTQTSFTLTTASPQDVQTATDIPLSGLPRNTPSTWTPFTQTIDAHYFTATGSQQDLDGTGGTTLPTATLNVRIMDDLCDAGGSQETAWDTCVSSPTDPNTLQFCQAGTQGCEGSGGAAGTLVTDCRGPDGTAGNGDDCGCDTGYTCQSNGQCTQDTCTSHGTYGVVAVGQCGTPIPGDLQSYPNANERYCATKDTALVEDCTNCPTGGTFGCADDYYGNAATGCTAGTCDYTGYTGGIDVGLS